MNYFDHLSKYRVTEQDLQDLEKFYAYDEGELTISDIDPKVRSFIKVIWRRDGIASPY